MTEDQFLAWLNEQRQPLADLAGEASAALFLAGILEKARALRDAERERCARIVEEANWAASSEAIIARIRSN